MEKKDSLTLTIFILETVGARTGANIYLLLAEKYNIGLYDKVGLDPPSCVETVIPAVVLVAVMKVEHKTGVGLWSCDG